jgi:hypothetical protein
MATAKQQRSLRRYKQRRKRCLWCERRAWKGKLCKRCGRKHRLRQRNTYEEHRGPEVRQYKCTVCGELGHNARRHKQQEG